MILSPGWAIRVVIDEADRGIRETLEEALKGIPFNSPSEA